jgi:hypothetical protein
LSYKWLLVWVYRIIRLCYSIFYYEPVVLIGQWFPAMRFRYEITFLSLGLSIWYSDSFIKAFHSRELWFKEVTIRWTSQPCRRICAFCSVSSDLSLISSVASESNSISIFISWGYFCRVNYGPSMDVVSFILNKIVISALVEIIFITFITFILRLFFWNKKLLSPCVCALYRDRTAASSALRWNRIFRIV